MMQQKECNKCHEVKSVSDFYQDMRTKDKLQRWCKSCMNDASTTSRKKKPAHYTKVRADRRKNNTILFREWKSEQGCYFCSETFSQCLELHHPNDDKEHDVADLANTSLKRMLEEAEKCIVVCANCHRKVHAGVLEV